ncbi:MAG TPA: hypothetical protein VEA37_04305 [Flavobacterium sp.]|nr:hypothetical protein [Flavobacterium sp.]
MGTSEWIVTVVILAILYIAPFAVFNAKNRLIKDYSFRKFVKTTNKTIAVYAAILIVMFLWLQTRSQPLIVDSQYPSPHDEYIAVGVIVIFGLSVIFLFLPLMLILNFANYFIRSKSNGLHKAEEKNLP